MDPAALALRLTELEGVAQIHDLHVWTITSGFPALSAHVLVEPGLDCHAVRMRLPGLGVTVDENAVRAADQSGHRWRNPVWRHDDGSLAEW